MKRKEGQEVVADPNVQSPTVTCRRFIIIIVLEQQLLIQKMANSSWYSAPFFRLLKIFIPINVESNLSPRTTSSLIPAMPVECIVLMAIGQSNVELGQLFLGVWCSQISSSLAGPRHRYGLGHRVRTFPTYAHHTSVLWNALLFATDTANARLRFKRAVALGQKSKKGYHTGELNSAWGEAPRPRRRRPRRLERTGAG